MPQKRRRTVEIPRDRDGVTVAVGRRTVTLTKLRRR